MNKATLAALVFLATTAAVSTPASAALRVPQIALSGGTLQFQINALNTGIIDVATQQEDLQRWKKNITGGSALTLAFELGGNPGGNEIGIYNAVQDDGESAGNLFPIFPASAEEGWYAQATFDAVNSRLTVVLFNALNVMQGGPVVHENVDVNDFSYYIRNGSTVGYAQDVLNDPGNAARALTFSGTGENDGGWFLCFEDGLQDGDDLERQDFDEVIVFLEAVRPVPAKSSTWASLKALYR